MKHRFSLKFAPAFLATCSPVSHGLSFSSLRTRYQAHHGYIVLGSRLFGLSNPLAEDDNKDVSHNLLITEKKSQSKPDGVCATETSAKAKANLEQKIVLRPHAPKTPRPPDKNKTPDEDESILNRAKDLLDTQAQVAASRSPTRRIAEEEYYRGMSTPESRSTKSFQEQDLLYEISNVQNDMEDTIPKVSTSLESSLQFLASGQGRIIPPHRTSMELLRDSRRRTQKLLSRREFEKEKAEEKKARIKAKMEEELLNVENRLRTRLDVVEAEMDQDVERMQALIYREMDLEEERMAQFNIRVQNLKASAQAIKNDIASETEILQEMETLLSKLEYGSFSAKQLDHLILRKQELVSIECDVLIDLEQCALETRRAFMNCERRRKTMQDVLDSVCRSVQFPASRECDWSSINMMEIILREATEEAEESEARVAELKDRIHRALMQKDAVLRESSDMQQRDNVENASAPAPVGLAGKNTGSDLRFSDLREMNESNVMNPVTYSGSKFTALAFKSLLDAVSGKHVDAAAVSSYENKQI